MKRPRNTFQNKLNRIRSSYRFRKNPNQENLKAALTHIEKIIPSKKLSLAKEEKQTKNEEIIKSDIENLLESQGNLYIKRKYFKKKSLKCVEAIESHLQECKDSPKINNNNNDTQRSDPSPVREKIKLRNFERSQTPKKKKKQIKRTGSSKLQVFIKSKVGKEFMEKYQNQKEVLGYANDNCCSFLTDNQSAEKEFYDYRQESLKILKDTSFFANKIMKGIRCPGRIKKCYL